jgi:hypothetical protein
VTEPVRGERGGKSMSSITIGRPVAGEYAPYHGGYVNEVPDGDVLALLERQARETIALLRGVGEQKAGHRYAAGKWSIREVIGHLVDAERVFTYRALTFARGDTTALPGFDENGWAAASNADTRTLASLIDEFSAVRAATLALFRGFGDAELARRGTASGHPVTVRGLLYVTTGHERHHVRILRERYLSAVG